MLSKRHKLSRSLFPQQKERKFSWTGRTLLIYGYAGGDAGSPTLFAVVVPKKKSSGSVSRNTFKRKVFAVIGDEIPRFERLLCRKYVIFPKGQIKAFSRDEIEGDINAFLASR